MLRCHKQNYDRTFLICGWSHSQPIRVFHFLTHTLMCLSIQDKDFFFFLSLCFAEWAGYRLQVITEDVAMATTNLQGDWGCSSCCDNSAAGIRWVEALCLAWQGQICGGTRTHQILLYDPQITYHSAFLYCIYCNDPWQLHPTSCILCDCK